MEKMLVGSIQKGEITSYGSEGEGILKVNGFPIFVPYAIVGDIVSVKILKSKKTFANGQIVEILEKSNNRSEDTKICPYFKKCGGCSIANMSYKSQLEFKKEKVLQTLKRIGKIEDIELYNTLGMTNPYFYRNKAQFPIEKVGDRIVIGFYQKKSHNIIEIKECLICNEKINIVRKKIEEFFNSKGYSVYNKNSESGLLRKLIVKTSFSTGEIMVIVVINGKELPYLEEFISYVKEIESVASLVINTNESNNVGNMGLKNKVIYGNDYITDSICNVDFQISPLSFYQVNPEQTERLYNKVLEFLQLSGNEVVVDCYCGIGTISLLLAKEAKKVIGIEVVDEAIESAIDNSSINGIENTEFLVGEVEYLINRVLTKNSVDAIVVDPPRKGLDEVVIKEIVNSKVKKIVYVSCDCGTLARDLKGFVSGGYVVEKVQPVDMFCHSSHVETVCLLSFR